MSRIRPTAFTLIELLVVMALIAMLAALLLPAVQQVREAARRTQCINNLTQIGLALHNYQMAFETLPPGVSNPTGPISNRPDGYHMSWLTQILPHIDQQNAFRKIDFREGVYAPVNQEVAAHPIGMLFCPSSPFTSRIVVVGNGTAALSSYVGIHHDVEAPIAEHQNGVLYLNSSVRYADISDGSSNTLFATEISSQRKPLNTHLGWMSGTPGTLRNAVVEVPAQPDQAKQAAGPHYELHGSWETIPIDPRTQSLKADYVGGPSSDHSSLFVALMGDGSVRVMSATVNASVFRRLAHRSDGELIDDF